MIKPVPPQMSAYGINQKCLDHFDYAKKGFENELCQASEAKKNKYGCLLLIAIPLVFLLLIGKLGKAWVYYFLGYGAIFFIPLTILEYYQRIKRKRKISNILKETHCSDFRQLVDKVEAYQDAVTSYEKDERIWDVQEAEKISQQHQKEFEEYSRLVEFWENLSPLDFEERVADLYRSLGYSARTTQASGDEGIDVWLLKDGNKTVVQCKRYKKPVTVGHIREFIGAMKSVDVKEGFFVALAGVTASAQRLADDNNVAIVNVDKLVYLANMK